MKNCNEKIEQLEKAIANLKKECLSVRKFKTGDWVCFNHGEYPEYFSQEVWQITCWTYDYNPNGSPMGAIHKSSGMAHSEDCLRYAHPVEIEYHLSKLPFIYNKKAAKYERIEINGDNFKIGDMIDTSQINNFTGKQVITFLLDSGLVSDDGRKTLSLIFEKLK